VWQMQKKTIKLIINGQNVSVLLDLRDTNQAALKQHWTKTQQPLKQSILQKIQFLAEKEWATEPTQIGTSQFGN